MQKYTHQIQLGADRQSLTERTASPAPISWGYLAGSAASSAAVGAGIGYLAASRSRRGAVTGAIAGASAWGFNSAINEFFLDHKVLSAVLATAGIGALVVAWNR